MRFRGKAITRVRLGWWLRTALTALFGRKVRIEGRDKPLKILPWIHRGELLLMGLEHESVSLAFKNQYTPTFRKAAVITAPDPDPRIVGDNSAPVVWVVVLGHQPKEVIESAMDRFRTLGPDYHHLLAYGGSEDAFGTLEIEEKIHIEDPSLRGPSHLMSHHEWLEKSWQWIRARQNGECFVVFTEIDLLPLKIGYLDHCIRMMRAHGADFAAKEIRDVSRTNNPFLINGIAAGAVAKDLSPCLHALGCFSIIRSTVLPSMIEACGKMKGLYFELMFPTAAARAGARLLGLESVCDDLRHVVYRPEYGPGDVARIRGEGYGMLHPFKPGSSSPPTT